MPYEYDKDLRDTRRELNRFGVWGIGWWIVVIIVLAVIGVAAWGITVAVSGVRGQGEGIIQKNSAQNWIAAQAQFEDNNQEYEATLVRIQTFHQAYLDDPTDVVSKTNWLGQISHCTDVVKDYNAASRKFLQEDFKSADLPVQLDLAKCTATQEKTQ